MAALISGQGVLGGVRKAAEYKPLEQASKLHSSMAHVSVSAPISLHHGPWVYVIIKLFLWKLLTAYGSVYSSNEKQIGHQLVSNCWYLRTVLSLVTGKESKPCLYQLIC